MYRFCSPPSFSMVVPRRKMSTALGWDGASLLFQSTCVTARVCSSNPYAVAFIGLPLIFRRQKRGNRDSLPRGMVDRRSGVQHGPLERSRSPALQKNASRQQVSAAYRPHDRSPASPRTPSTTRTISPCSEVDYHSPCTPPSTWSRLSFSNSHGKQNSPRGSPKHDSRARSRPSSEFAGLKEGLGKQWKTPRRSAEPSAPPASMACMSALGLVAVSGFAAVANGLERACLDLGNACREGAPWRVKVIPCLMPAHLTEQFWRTSDRPWSKKRAMRAAQRAELLAESRLIPRKLVKRLRVVRDCDLTFLIWPPALKRVEFELFDVSIERVTWPSTLEEIQFTGTFDRSIERVAWPASLRVLQLTSRFNQPVGKMKLPPGIERVEFGDRFNSPISDVIWPAGLRALEFGAKFNRCSRSQRLRLPTLGETAQRGDTSLPVF